MELSVLLVVLLGYICNDTYHHELNDAVIGGKAVEGGVS